MAQRRMAPPPDARQEQLLKEAKNMVKVQAFQMKRALDSDNIMEALKHASNMISELRTGLLHPRSYYDLYIFVIAQLQHLEGYIAEGSHNKSLHELYELVQYAGNILPRLYLLITVGSVYIKKMQAPAKDVLYDVVELCRGVQHPTRGLFLRTYLSEMTKDKLPDEGSKYEGDVTDSIDFILANFIEMNKLWVRMQHGIRDLDKREQEREELNILVGKNLSRLSQLEGLTIGLYKSDVLPRVLTQIESCKDRIAQQNLMVILIQAFSDEFHLRTLDQLLDTCHKLVDEVDVHFIITSLIDRLANYCVSHSTSLPTDIDMFQMFQTYIDELAKSRKTMTLDAILDLGNSLISLSMRCYKEKPEYIDNVYDFASSHIESKGLTEDKRSIEQALRLLQNPSEYAKSIKPLLHLKSWTKLLNLLPDKEKRTIALYLISHTIKNEIHISSPDEVVVLLDYLKPVTIRNPDSDTYSEEDWYDDQTQVSNIISMVGHKDVETMFAILQKAKEHFTSGNVNVGPLFTMVPLTFKALALVQYIYKQKEQDTTWEKKAKVVFRYANDAITIIKGTDVITAFNLYLQATLQAARCGLSEFANGFLTQGALVLFEDEQISQTKQEFNAIRQLIAVVQSLTCFDNELYNKLAIRIVQLTSKLLVYDYQSRATVLSAYLFIPYGRNANFKDPKSVLSCLKKAITLAGSVVEVDVLGTLWVLLLDHYLYFYEKHPDIVDAKYVNAVIQKINKHISVNNVDHSHPSYVHYKNINSFVVAKQNWENLVKKEKPKKDAKDSKESGVEVEGEVGLSESEARSEAERWKEITFENQ